MVGHDAPPGADRVHRESSEVEGDRNASGGSGLPANVAGALAYAFGPFSGAVMIILDEARPFVRFHALQSIALTVAWVCLWAAVLFAGLLLRTIPWIGWPVFATLRLVVIAGSVALWGTAIWRAHQGREWRIPVIGTLVRQVESGEGTGSGLPPAQAGALAYLLGPLTGLLFLRLDGTEPFVRFHALQAIGLGTAGFGAWILLILVRAALGLFAPFAAVGALLTMVLAIVALVVWGLATLQALLGRTWRLPLIGAWAATA